jgi:glycosyltransferase involved in cell wall biosynthesis
MKIGFDAKRAFGNNTGLGNYARWVIMYLAKLYPQYELYLFTPTTEHSFSNEISQFEQVKIISPQGPQRLFKSLWRTYSIADLCNELSLDAYHGLSNELPIGIESFTGKKIVTIHDLIFLRYPNYYNNIDRYIYRKKFEYAAKVSDTIVAISQQTALDIAHHLTVDSDKIVVKYQSCVHTKNSTTSLPDRIQKPYLLCVGTIEPRKQQLNVLKAFNQAKIPELNLYFVGRKTSYAAELYSYISQYELSNSVAVLDNVNNEMLANLYSQAIAVVYNSEFEGFGIPALEALNYQKPLLASTAQSVMEIGGDAALYNHACDVAQLASNMQKIASNESLRIELIAKGSIQAAKFETEKLIHHLVSVYAK